MPLLSTAGIEVSIRWVQQGGDRQDSRRRDADRGGGRGSDVRLGGTVGDPGPVRTLLVFRFDVHRNALPVRARGGGESGARRLVAVTLARAVSLLVAHGLRPRLLDCAAALRVLSDFGVGRRARRRSSRGPVARDHEKRRSARHSGRWYRLLRLSGPAATSALPATGAAAHRADARSWAGNGGPDLTGVVTSNWIRAGPDGTVRRGGSVRLSADSEAQLDDLERALRRGWNRSGGDLRVAIDEQWPTLVEMLPWGGPG